MDYNRFQLPDNSSSAICLSSSPTGRPQGQPSPSHQNPPGSQEDKTQPLLLVVGLFAMYLERSVLGSKATPDCPETGFLPSYSCWRLAEQSRFAHFSSALSGGVSKHIFSPSRLASQYVEPFVTLHHLHRKQCWCASLNTLGSCPVHDCVRVTALLGLGPYHGSVNKQWLRKCHESAFYLKEWK